MGLETHKAAVGVESDFTGRIRSLSAKVDDTVSQGDTLGLFESLQPKRQ